jgi:hypothetical protein
LSPARLDFLSKQSRSQEFQNAGDKAAMQEVDRMLHEGARLELADQRQSAAADSESLAYRGEALS